MSIELRQERCYTFEEYLEDYQDSGVKEYWIIDPKDKKLDVNILKGGKYELTTYTFNNIIDVQALPGCQLDLTMFKQ